MMESTTGLPKETNSDMSNVQKRANIFCEKCNVGLHPDCFKDFHIK